MIVFRGYVINDPTFSYFAGINFREFSSSKKFAELTFVDLLKNPQNRWDNLPAKVSSFDNPYLYFDQWWWLYYKGILRHCKKDLLESFFLLRREEISKERKPTKLPSPTKNFILSFIFFSQPTLYPGPLFSFFLIKNMKFTSHAMHKGGITKHISVCLKKTGIIFNVYPGKWQACTS